MQHVDVPDAENEPVPGPRFLPNGKRALTPKQVLHLKGLHEINRLKREEQRRLVEQAKRIVEGKPPGGEPEPEPTKEAAKEESSLPEVAAPAQPETPEEPKRAEKPKRARRKAAKAAKDSSSDDGSSSSDDERPASLKAQVRQLERQMLKLKYKARYGGAAPKAEPAINPQPAPVIVQMPDKSEAHKAAQAELLRLSQFPFMNPLRF